MQQVTVHKADGRYCGWPANNGLWSWGGESVSDSFEIVVGFSYGYMNLDVGDSLHPIDKSRPGKYQQARSADGGETWALDDSVLPTGPATEHTGGIDFTAPGFALKCSGESYYLSDDRARTWNGPYRLLSPGDRKILARTDYQVYGPSDCLVFLTANKPNEREGRVYCMRTTDGGVSWRFVSWIGPDPNWFSIMPSSLRLPDGRLLCTIRRKECVDEESPETNWIEMWTSTDEGESWEYVNNPVPDTGHRSGNPPSLVQLPTGRLVLTYAYRDEPIGIRARTSDDEGATWSDEIVLRPNAGNRDLGYTRTVVRPDGKLFTSYYWNDDPSTERYIGGTIWDA
jgi:hypothetical protein